MNLWTDVRRAVIAGEMSRRDACKKYNLNFRTIHKILSHEEPPGYRRGRPRVKPKLGPMISIIHEIIEADKKIHKKQRHTGRRIFERLRDEHGYTGGLTVVQDELQLVGGEPGVQRSERHTGNVGDEVGLPVAMRIDREDGDVIAGCESQ